MRAWLPAISIALVVSVLVNALMLAVPDDQPYYGVVFSPETSRYDAFARVIESGGTVVREGLFPFIVIAYAQDQQFMDVVKTTGAKLIVNPILFGSCYVEEKNQLFYGSNPR